ncbi:N(G),N(G)-dimethylarginine dimethylaminohydrolase 1 [Geranomyces variabilis]|uniref:N(G),N(G)-dimethylarginine dimethylaminohydrolase 1 n=1 Tax=Geranomyces variabilis TaxID=109894 RepID=A0AAD5TK67_9FUNG|nr:N(G),N(G)-dimethylarginine dimethylaminohydrolase 1 [Geranomyces variabilis]
MAAPVRTAIVRARMPDSYATSCLTDVNLATAPIDLALARAQHQKYVATIRRFVPVVELPFLGDEYPDAIFVEDTVLVAKGLAIITRPGADSRRREVESMAECLKVKTAKGATTTTTTATGVAGATTGDFTSIDAITAIEAPGTLDGGDCCLTGRHVFVGLSKRTNQAAIDQLDNALRPRGIPVIAVPIADTHILHLKCVVSVLAADTLVVSDSVEGRMVRERIEALNTGYKFVVVPDVVAANVLAIRGSGDALAAVIVQDRYPESQKALRAAMRARGEEDKVIELDLSEIIKGDGALTCMSVLI